MVRLILALGFLGSALLHAEPLVDKKDSTENLRSLIAMPKTKLKVGETVPNFTLPSTGEPFSLENLRGKHVVLYFYPKDSTPGCTRESQDFTRLKKKFQAAGAEIFGISRDSMKSHERFVTNSKLGIDLLSDEDEKICKLFDVIKMKNMYGKQVRGIERSTFVIDKNGVLVREWRKVKVDGHAEEVLKFVQSL